MTNNSADYIELSIHNTEDNDEPPDHVEHGEQILEKDQEYKATTALLTDIEENDSIDDFILYENDENKTKPKHENTLALQVIISLFFYMSPLLLYINCPIYTVLILISPFYRHFLHLLSPLSV